MKNGDYVFATKYDDGDPADGWAVGFYDGRVNQTTHKDRYLVIDGEGVQFRRNGFRRVEEISEELGVKLIESLKKFDYDPAIHSCPMDAWGAPGEVNLWDLVADLKGGLS